MKNRISLALMEQLVMVLVFALAAALCLNVFVKADEISRTIAYRDDAVLIAQNAAEMLQATSGDVQRTTEQLGSAAAEKGLRMVIEKTDSGVPLLGKAEIWVYFEEEELFNLQTGWQEGQ